jgi:hypothetical protein
VAGVGSRLLLCLLATLGAVLGPASTTSATVGDVPAGETLVVIGQSGVERADAFGEATGTLPAGAMWYLGLYETPDAAEAQLERIGRAVEERPGLLVNLGLTFGAISTPYPPQTAAIAAGLHDETIDRLAAWLKETDTVVYLRPGYEFDLLGGQYGPPEVYKAAYRHVVDRLRAAGVDNAHYVWHSAGAFWRGTDASLFAVMSGAVATAVREHAGPADVQPIAAFYPGPEYVDSFGFSYWRDSCCFGRSGPAARAVYEARTREILDEAEALGLPLQISEATPVYVGADSGEASLEWIDATFDLVEERDVRMLSLISIDWREGGFFAAPFWNGYWPDARIHHHADARERYLERIAPERYVHRSADLPARLGLPSRD